MILVLPLNFKYNHKWRLWPETESNKGPGLAETSAHTFRSEEGLRTQTSLVLHQWILFPKSVAFHRK